MTPGTDVIIFKIFAPKNLAIKRRFLLKQLLISEKIAFNIVFFCEKRQFFRRK
jgi:hypothetical protein